MKFIDTVQIEVKAGDGGAGSSHFRREKFIPFGGPDGGNGGAGGSVILVADRNRHTLLDFQFKPRWEAKDGTAGGSARKDGKAGEDLIIPVPIGTQVLNPETKEVIADLSTDQQTVVIAKGGRGGKGNTFFKSATNRAPDYSQPGESGDTCGIILSLKLVADVGLVGFPNAGKSTFISRVSSARPKIADYPFTTLTPNLGVVQAKGGRSFVIADIPGLIPEAHKGKGLGIQFLKHIERTRVLLHLVDPLQIDEQGELIPAKKAFDIIRAELSAFSEDLIKKPFIVAITKADAITDSEFLNKCIKDFQADGIKCHIISSVSGLGVEELVNVLADFQSNDAGNADFSRHT